MEDKKAPGILFSLTLAVFLIFPYLLKLKSREPYPAIIMPSGHGRKELKANFVSNYEFQFAGIKGNKVFQIDPKNLFPNVPQQCYLPIIKNNLGFLTEQDVSQDIGNWKYLIAPWKNNKFFGQEELKSYYIKNIEVPVDSIRVRQKITTRDSNTGDLINERITSSTSYSLK